MKFSILKPDAAAKEILPKSGGTSVQPLQKEIGALITEKVEQSFQAYEPYTEPEMKAAGVVKALRG